MDQYEDEKFLKYCNHHHKPTENHSVVDLGGETFIANNEAIPLLVALHDMGLRTRTHHYDGGNSGFFSILLDDGVRFEVRKVHEKDATRTKYNGQTELLISWYKGEENEG